MNLCQLNQFENISELRKKAVVCPDGRKMGRVIDVVFEENLNMHSFIIGGSFWEEFRESIKAMMYSQMKRMKIVDYSNKSIGKICNMLFLPCGEPTFVVNANKTDIIPKGITSHWDLLVPHTNISEMSASYLKLNVNAEQLSMALNDHVLDADAAREYLNSLRKKNTAEMRAVARTNTGNYYR
ncbi:MAG: PRC-barrel domain-containing protein [Candidatus Heimdallarchaeota archaeon]